jgi:hypothetical protein
MSNWFQQWVNRNSDSPRPGYHSTPYHRHFEGYTEMQITEPNGSRKITRVYTGQYYSQDMSGKHRILNRLLYAALYIAAVALFLFCASASNTTWYITAAQALAVLGFFRMLYVLINYMTAPQKMEVGFYRATSGPLIKSSRITAIALWLLSLLTLIYILLHTDKNVIAELIYMAGYVCSGVAVFLISLFESRITYNRTRSEHETSGNGVEIDI